MFHYVMIGNNDNQKKKFSSPNWKISLSITLLSLLVIASALVILVSPGKSAHATSPSFTFTATGDYGSTQNTINNMKYISNTSGAAFNLGLGDFNYDTTVSANTWYNTYAKPYIPTSFPFEIVAGDHDTQLSQLAVDLPDRIGLGSQSTAYAQQYYFDYPATSPLARFIMVSPVVLSQYHYNKGGADYNWVSQRIADARSAGIRWVIVGMAEGCLFIYSPSDKKACSSANADLLNLLVGQKVDLILQAHVHAYLRSKQLALGANCTAINTTGYNPQCVVDSSSSLTEGNGTVIVNTGTGGKSLISLNTNPNLSSYDPKTGYFASWMGSNANPRYGVSQFTISNTQISMQYVTVTKVRGSFADSFTITPGGVSPSPTTTVPATASVSPSATASASPSATATGGTTIAQDNFTRANHVYWGTSSGGQTWAANANSYKVFSISNNTGLVKATSNNNYYAVLGPTATDATVQFNGSASTFTGTHLGAVLRWTNNQNWYEAYIDGANLVIDKKVGGKAAKIGTVPFSATIGTSYTLLFNVSGSTLNASVWPTSGGSQPANWMLTKTDSSLASGNCGLHMVVQTGTTLTYTAFQAMAG